MLSRRIGIARSSELIPNRVKRHGCVSESDLRFWLMADVAPFLIWISGPDGRWTYLNKPWLRFTGRTLREEVGHGWTESLHPADLENCLNTYNEAHPSQKPFVREYRLRRHDLSYRWISETAMPRFDKQGAFEGYTGSCIDITETRKAAERASHDLNQRLIRAQEEERARLARELHDDITQRLACFAIDIGRVERGLPLAELVTTVGAVREGIARLSDDVHALSYQLHPSLLSELGFADALRAECERFSKNESIPAAVNLSGVPTSLSRDAQLGLFRIAQESLRNIVRHARATTVEVTLTRKDGGVQLVINDNGVGFEPLKRNGMSLGLASMRERMRLLGGALDVVSAPGRGTHVRAWAPLEQQTL
jgi:PAS domain S-box-containing protein